MSSLSIVEAKLPPGFRFHPRDDELICDYLMKKKDTNNNVNISSSNSKIKSEVATDYYYSTSEIDSSSSSSSPSSSTLLIEVDLNKCEPWDIPKQACVGGKDFYFYSQRDRKYATGLRTNRATVSGYWKATGKDRPIARKGHLVGMRKTLVFYQGRAPKGRKTNWVMHEFRIEGPHGPPPLSASSKEDWVLCRVFRKSAESSTKQSQDIGDEDDHDQLIGITHCHGVDDETASPASTLPALMDSYIAFDHRRRKISTEMNHEHQERLRDSTIDHHHHQNSIINNNVNSNIHAYEQVPCFSSNMFSQNQATSFYPATAFPHHSYSNTTDINHNSSNNNMINMTTTGINPMISFGGYSINHNHNHAFGGSILTQDGILAPHSASSTSNVIATINATPASGEMNCHTGSGTATYVFDNNNNNTAAVDQLSACDKHVIKAVLSQLTKMQEGSIIGANSNLQMLGKDASPVVSLGEAASSDQSYLSDVGLHNPPTSTTTTMWNNQY